jgi:two-component system NtrC family sensor kinase
VDRRGKKPRARNHAPAGARLRCYERVTCGVFRRLSEAVKLTAKFMLAFLLTTLVLVATNAALRVEAEIDHFDTATRQRSASYCASLARAFSVTARKAGRQEALELLEYASQSAHMRTRWIALDGGRPDLPAPLVSPATVARHLGSNSMAFQIVPSGTNQPGALVFYAPVTEVGATALEVVESLEAHDRFSRAAILRAVWLAVIIVVGTTHVVLIVGLVILARPLHALRLKVRRIANGDLSGPLVVRGRDELREVADEINLMCEQLGQARQTVEFETTARIAALEQVRHADRLATTGRLAAGIAHEIGTPLAVVAGRAQLIAKGEVQGAEAAANARIVVEQTKRISTIIRQLLDFARKRPARRALTNLTELAQRTALLLESLAKQRTVTLDVTAQGAAQVMAEVDVGQIEQVLTNLIVNALHATPRGGRVEISAGRVRAKPPEQTSASERAFATIAVSDTGRGIAPETITHLFEPFYTTKEVGEGSGLGLAVTHGIVFEHGGFIVVTSELDKGSRFTVHLPLPLRDEVQT